METELEEGLSDSISKTTNRVNNVPWRSQDHQEKVTAFFKELSSTPEDLVLWGIQQIARVRGTR